MNKHTLLPLHGADTKSNHFFILSLLAWMARVILQHRYSFVYICVVFSR